jgi:hypothetical protein
MTYSKYNAVVSVGLYYETRWRLGPRQIHINCETDDFSTREKYGAKKCLLSHRCHQIEIASVFEVLATTMITTSFYNSYSPL